MEETHLDTGLVILLMLSALISGTMAIIAFFSGWGVIGAFLIYNAQTLSVLARHQQLARWHVLGVSRRQVFALISAAAIIVGMARNGLSLAGFDPLWQDFTIGVLVIVAVTLDQWIRRVSA